MTGTLKNGKQIEISYPVGNVAEGITELLKLIDMHPEWDISKAQVKEFTRGLNGYIIVFIPEER